MLSGLDRAVGPVHRNEKTQRTLYVCQTGLVRGDNTCLFRVWDAGPGKAILECATHSYTVLAADWTSAHFTAESLTGRLARIRELLAELGVEADKPNVRQERFEDVFVAIEEGLRAIAKRENV